MIQSLFGRTCQTLIASIDNDKPNIPRVQACLVGSLFCLITDKSRCTALVVPMHTNIFARINIAIRCQILLEMAIQWASLLGLHESIEPRDEQADVEGFGVADEELPRRLWWCCALMEAYQSAWLGRSVSHNISLGGILPTRGMEALPWPIIKLEPVAALDVAILGSHTNATTEGIPPSLIPSSAPLVPDLASPIRSIGTSLLPPETASQPPDLMVSLIQVSIHYHRVLKFLPLLRKKPPSSLSPLETNVHILSEFQAARSVSEDATLDELLKVYEVEMPILNSALAELVRQLPSLNALVVTTIQDVNRLMHAFFVHLLVTASYMTLMVSSCPTRLLRRLI